MHIYYLEETISELFCTCDYFIPHISKNSNLWQSIGIKDNFSTFSFEIADETDVGRTVFNSGGS